MLDVGNILKQKENLGGSSSVMCKVTGSCWRGLFLKQDITEKEDQGGSGGNPYIEPEETKTYKFYFTMHSCGFELPNNTQREVA